MSKDNENLNIEELQSLLESLDFTSQEDLEFLQTLNELVVSTTEAAQLITDKALTS